MAALINSGFHASGLRRNLASQALRVPPRKCLCFTCRSVPWTIAANRWRICRNCFCFRGKANRAPAAAEGISTAHESRRRFGCNRHNDWSTGIGVVIAGIACLFAGARAAARRRSRTMLSIGTYYGRSRVLFSCDSEVLEQLAHELRQIIARRRLACANDEVPLVSVQSA